MCVLSPCPSTPPAGERVSKLLAKPMLFFEALDGVGGDGAGLNYEVVFVYLLNYLFFCFVFRIERIDGRLLAIFFNFFFACVCFHIEGIDGRLLLIIYSLCLGFYYIMWRDHVVLVYDIGQFK